jgi:hypothetical protein
MVRPRPYRDAGAGRDSRLGAWESVYYKQDAATPGFSLFPREGQHKGAYCVWELGPVWHEQQAWVRFLTSARDATAQQAYLDDRFAGSVG